MANPDEVPLPEPLVEWLVQYDALLESGTPPHDAADATPVDPLLSDRFQKARRCLDLIERVRRSDSSVHASLSAAWDEFPVTVDVDSAATPARIGRFEILGELGRGGYGVVLLAHDPQLDRKVALKVPRPEVVVTATLRERFLREGKAVAGLNHANLVPVFEAGSAGPICYLASAYCRGLSMAQWLAERDAPVPFDLAARLMLDLADGMQHAHSRGVVHRDLKPGNILLDECDATGGELGDPESFIPRITDFGLAKVARSDSQMTRDGAILGTPSYMSPEQAGGRIERVGPPSDLYSLGGVLYELITRRPPFHKATDLATLRAVESDEPVPPRRQRPETPRDLEAICLKCLEKKPQNRYPSASALAADLARFLAGEPVRARRVGSGERLWRWCRRNPVVSSLTASVVLLLVALAVGSTVALVRLADLQQRTREAKELAETNLLVAERNLAKAREAVETMLTEVGLSRLTSMPHMEPTRRRLLEEAEQFYEDLVASDSASTDLHLDRALSLYLLGRMNRWLGDNDKSLKYLSRARDQMTRIRRQSPGEPRCLIGLASVLYDLGEVHMSLSQFDNASAAYRAALAIHQSFDVTDPDPMQPFLEAQTLSSLGQLKQTTGGDTQEIEQHYRQAIERFKEVRDRLNATEVGYQLSLTTHRLAGLHWHTNHPELAERSYRETLELIDEVVELQPMPDFRREKSSVQLDLAYLLLSRRRFDEARELYDEGLDGAMALARDFPSVMSYHYHHAAAQGTVGWSLYRAGKYDEARVHLARSVEIAEDLVSRQPGVPDYQAKLANAQNLLGLALEELDLHAESFAMLLDSLKAWRQLVERFPTVPEYQSELGALLNNVAMRHQARGDDLAACTMFEEAVAWQKKALRANPRHPTYRQFLMNHYAGLFLNYLGRSEYVKAAETAVERAQAQPDSWSAHYDAARHLVRSTVAVRSDQSVAAERREEIARFMIEKMDAEIGRAVECLPAEITDPDSIADLAWLLLRNPIVPARRPDAALEVARRVVASRPDLWYAHGIAAAAQLSLGSAAEAQSGLEQVVANSDDPRWQLFLAQAVHAGGRHEEARQRFDQFRDVVLERFPRSNDMQILIAETAERLDAP